jgi:hypothetical protein
MAAGLSTLLHRWIIAKAGTIIGTTRTCFRTYPTHLGVQFRPAKHKISTGGTDLRTIEQPTNMAGLCVMPALLEAILSGSDTYAMAFQAILDALLHLGPLMTTLDRTSHHGIVPFCQYLQRGYTVPLAYG